MDAEILHTLQEIRGILYVIGGICFFGFVVWGIRAASQIAVNLHSVVTACWKNTASSLFDKGKYDALLGHCSTRLKSMPNDALALWWAARANRELGNCELSEQQFRKVLKLSPNWASSVNPFLGEDAAEAPR